MLVRDLRNCLAAELFFFFRDAWEEVRSTADDSQGSGRMNFILQLISELLYYSSSKVEEGGTRERFIRGCPGDFRWPLGDFPPDYAVT